MQIYKAHFHRYSGARKKTRRMVFCSVKDASLQGFVEKTHWAVKDPLVLEGSQRKELVWDIEKGGLRWLHLSELTPEPLN